MNIERETWTWRQADEDKLLAARQKAQNQQETVAQSKGNHLIALWPLTLERGTVAAGDPFIVRDDAEAEELIRSGNAKRGQAPGPAPVTPEQTEAEIEAKAEKPAANLDGVQTAAEILGAGDVEAAKEDKTGGKTKEHKDKNNTK